MLLGDVLAKFEEAAFATEALFAIDDIVLTTRIVEAAAREELTPGEFATQSIRRFVNGASNEEWLTLIGLMARGENPSQVFLRSILSNSLATRLEQQPSYDRGRASC